MKHYAIILIFLVFSCDGRSQEKNADEIYLSQNQPFSISKGEKYIYIPDSLRLQNLKEGMLVISYFVNSDGITEGINLKLLRIKDTAGKELISYYNDNMQPIQSGQYPKEVRPYLNWVYQYAKTREIIRIGDVEDNLKWMMSIMVRLN